MQIAKEVSREPKKPLKEMTSNLINLKIGQTGYFWSVTQTGSKEGNKLLKFVENLLMLIELSKNKIRTIKLLSRAIQRVIQSMYGSQKFRKQGTKTVGKFPKIMGIVQDVSKIN